MTKRNRLFLKSILIKILNNQYIEIINKKILIKKIDEINQLLYNTMFLIILKYLNYLPKL